MTLDASRGRLFSFSLLLFPSPQVLGNTNQEEKHQYRARKLYKESVTSKVRQIACNSNSLVALLGTLCTPPRSSDCCSPPPRRLIRCVALLIHLLLLRNGGDRHHRRTGVQRGDAVIPERQEHHPNCLRAESLDRSLRHRIGLHLYIRPLLRLFQRLLTHHDDARHTQGE